MYCDMCSLLKYPLPQYCITGRDRVKAFYILNIYNHFVLSSHLSLCMSASGGVGVAIYNCSISTVDQRYSGNMEVGTTRVKTVPTDIKYRIKPFNRTPS